MISPNNSWQIFREQLMQIGDTMIPSAPREKSMRNIINDNHWMEFDVDVLIGEKENHKLGTFIRVNELNHSIVMTNIQNNDGLLHSFDIILSFNDIKFTNITEETAQCIINAHQGKIIKMRIRRLQPTSLETIEFNIRKKNTFLTSRKLGFTIAGGIGKSNDPGLFIVGIEPNGRAANHGHLRIGDRLIHISNTHSTLNLQCIDFDIALKLIKRMRNESTSITIVIAHQTQN